MLISIQQIKAARALLDWNQEDLANHAGLSTDHIRRIETNRSKSSDVLDAIYQAMTFHGVVFTKHGVELKPNAISIIEGVDWYLRLLDDVARSTPKELLFFYADDRASPPEVNQRLKKMRAAGVQMRQLVEEGNTYLMGPVSEYRYVPKERFENYVSLVYGDKVAICTDSNTKATVFNDPHLANVWRNIFSILWDTLKQPERSDAKERF